MARPSERCRPSGIIQDVTHSPHPALVTQLAAQRLPRLALLLLCAAYVLPGIFRRDPWRGADLNAFGQMLALAEGRAPWLVPALGGVPTDDALLPNWIGAVAIMLTQGWLDPATAARLPFGLLLTLTLVAVWYACFHLALSEGAQPMPLAFGGEAAPVDYARAIADGAVLALIATLGLLQLGHETTPELVQLAAVACLLWSLAAFPRRGWRAGLGLLLAWPALAASDAPSVALALGLATLLLSLHPAAQAIKAVRFWVAAAMLLSVLAAWPTHAWAWRIRIEDDPAAMMRQWIWFLWPTWPLALLTVWRWRRQLAQPHLGLPLLVVLVALATNVGMDGSDRALMLGLPGWAVLAAFALPTLRRSSAAAMDWFSVFFFSLCALTVWLMYVAMQTGIPAKPAANILKLAPGFEPHWSMPDMLLALLGTVAWLGLVRWRTGRHRSAIWKSLVLPASGVALIWLLLMTLWLPLLDYARSNRPLAMRLARHVPDKGCVAAPGANDALVAALEWHARLRVDASAQSLNGKCPVLVLVRKNDTQPVAAEARAKAAGWTLVARERRPTERREVTLVYRRPD